MKYKDLHLYLKILEMKADNTEERKGKGHFRH